MNFFSIQRHSLKTRVMLFTLTIFLISLWSLAFYVSQMLRQDMQRLLGEQQRSTVSMVAEDVDKDLSSRLQALEKIASNISPAMMANPALLQKMLDDRPIFQDLFSWGSFITGPEGTALASTPPSADRRGVNYLNRDYIAAALKEGRVSIGRVTAHAKAVPVVAMAVPIRNGGGQVIGAVAGVINLGIPNFLDQIEKNHYGQTGGYVLVETKYRRIITATDKSRILQFLPAMGLNPAVDQRIQGDDSPHVAVNQLGEQILSSAARIPVAAWFLVVSLPTQEAFAPIRAMQQRMLLATLFLTLLAGGLTWWMLRRQLAPLQSTARALAALSDKSQPVLPLPIVRQDEIGQLVSGFNRLLEDLAQRQEGLRESEERYRTAFRTSPDAVNITRLADGCYLEVNDGFVHLFGWSQEEVIGKTSRDIGIWRNWDDRMPLMLIMQKEGHCESFETDFLTKGGKVITALVSANVITLSGQPCMLSVTRDITARRLAQDQIQQLAFSDPLTGLANRRLLIDRLDQALAARDHHHRQGTLMLVDLDFFKTLNDTLGHEKGDLLLKQAAHRLLGCVRAGDTVARFGGDEFCVLLEYLSPNLQEAATQAETVAEKILFVLSLPYQLDGTEYQGTSSIGITLFDQQRENTVEPLKRAELAMYQAKAAGRNILRFFDAKMQAVVSARAALEAGLRAGIKKNEIILHYQAQVTGERQIMGVEALVRWQDPLRGMISPAEFIPMAEETGLILPLGRRVMEIACQQLASWGLQPETAHLTVAVNVSARQFHQADFVDQVLAMLERTGANPNRLKLELTESLLVNDVEGVIIKMNALKGLGVGFSLDDFGVGYSSLSYLKRLPLDQLKIDQGFVRDILVDSNDAAIAKMVIVLASSMGLAVIAEGVETEAQRRALAEMGCNSYQGYLFARPLPVEDFEALLARHAAGR